MPALLWDVVGEKEYQTGVDHGVLYLQRNGLFNKGIAWSGLTTVTENNTGAEDNAFYADNIKYLVLKSIEEFGLTVECYTYPDEFGECNGEIETSDGVIVSQQHRRTFGLSYRTRIGNDVDGDETGYKIHLVWNCSASPTEHSHTTVNESPEPMTFSFEITTTPIAINGKDEFGKRYRPTSHIIIDSTRCPAEKLAELEEILYGKDETSDGAGDGVEPRLPLPSEIINFFL